MKDDLGKRNLALNGQDIRYSHIRHHCFYFLPLFLAYAKKESVKSLGSSALSHPDHLSGLVIQHYYQVTVAFADKDIVLGEDMRSPIIGLPMFFTQELQVDGLDFFPVQFQMTVQFLNSYDLTGLEFILGQSSRGPEAWIEEIQLLDRNLLTEGRVELAISAANLCWVLVRDNFSWHCQILSGTGYKFEQRKNNILFLYLILLTSLGCILRNKTYLLSIGNTQWPVYFLSICSPYISGSYCEKIRLRIKNIFRRCGMSILDRREFLKLCLLGCSASIEPSSLLIKHWQSRQKLPNIVLILADDLGYGDIGCYNPESKIMTPHLNRLASEGIRFMDAHSPSAVCTPSRYGLLTGRMPFRNGTYGVFTGAGGPCLIDEGRVTIPRMLKKKGYSTACIGKWHLGMTFFDKNGQPINKNGLEAVQKIDYSHPISGTPINYGFDYFFGTACCPTTDWLYAYIEGNQIPVAPTRIFDRTSIPDHPYSKDLRLGMIAPDYNLEQVDLVFLEKSKTFLKNHVKTNPNKPFFLYHCTQAVHLPSLPADRFKGQTNLGPHGDFIFELDFIVGELLKTLEQLGVAENTLVMFSSDNGPETTTTYHMRRDYGHDPARPWRGMKRDQWEGGHRVPFIVRWPGHIKTGQMTNQMTSLTDVIATIAAIVEVNLPEDAGEDSYSMLPVLLGKQGEKSVRDYLIQQSFRPQCLSIRHGYWKYLNHQGSGGNSYERSEELKEYIIPDILSNAPGQLYDLSTDPGERVNLYYEKPKIVFELNRQLEKFKVVGRSTPPHR